MITLDDIWWDRILYLKKSLHIQLSKTTFVRQTNNDEEVVQINYLIKRFDVKSNRECETVYVIF